VLLLPLQSKLPTTVEEKRGRRIGAVAAYALDGNLMATTQAEPSRHGATAESPIPCRNEMYISSAGKT
jgi:hypothetical protein